MRPRRLLSEKFTGMYDKEYSCLKATVLYVMPFLDEDHVACLRLCF